MKRSLVACAVACALAFPPVAVAQAPAAPAQARLEQMLAPIALYPDALLSQMLMASTYPGQVAQATHRCALPRGFVAAPLQNEIGAQPWDGSVKSLCAFPAILDRMTQGAAWTQSLGQAFTAQQQQVLDTIQSLRRQARATGHLRSNARMTISTVGNFIDLQPANPRVLYVPTYDPSFVYGRWRWPDLPPYFPAHWSAGVAFVDGFYWGAGVTVEPGRFWGGFDWAHHVARVSL